MRKKVLWITETAVMLALLVTLQALTKPMGQLVLSLRSRMTKKKMPAAFRAGTCQP